MLRSIKELYGYKISAKDGDLGEAHDFFFDDRIWTIRYLVVDIGSIVPGKKVLLVPSVLEPPVWEMQTFPVSLAKALIKVSPEIDVDKPVSRRCEIELHKHYKWAPYWLTGPLGVGPIPPVYSPSEQEKEQSSSQEEKGDPHLRSTKEVMGYHIQATNGEIGHVEEFIVDDADWNIRYMVVDTQNWLPGKKVLVSPGWIKRVSWAESKVYIELPIELIKDSPEYNPSDPVNREYEEGLYDYYGRTKYWK